MFGSNNGDATRVKYTEKSLKTTLGFLFHVSSIYAFRILANFSPLRVRFFLAFKQSFETWLKLAWFHAWIFRNIDHFIKWRGARGTKFERYFFYLFFSCFRIYPARTELISRKRARRKVLARMLACRCSSFSLLKSPNEAWNSRYLVAVHGG